MNEEEYSFEVRYRKDPICQKVSWVEEGLRKLECTPICELGNVYLCKIGDGILLLGSDEKTSEVICIHGEGAENVGKVKKLEEYFKTLEEIDKKRRKLEKEFERITNDKRRLDKEAIEMLDKIKRLVNL